MRDVMLDLETLSTSPRAAIVQIGACFFDRYTGEIGPEFKMNCEPSNHYVIDYSTVAWWLRQSNEARLSVFPAGVVGIHEAAFSFSRFVDPECRSDEFRVWAMPSAFDVVIMENAFAVEHIPTPWKYNASRDVRTILEAAGLGKEDRVEPTVAHDALADAIAQAKTVAKAFTKLKGVK